MNSTRHLMVLITDHFEPAEVAAVRSWEERYPRAVAECLDDDDRPLRYTWFYHAEEPAVLDSLGRLARGGWGEIELHLHHDHDTSDSLRARLERRKQVYAEHGALITIDDPPKRVYGFIHGKWALDNSRLGRSCGVNNELQVLRETGCYADFTFPAWWPMQPAMHSRVYYAKDDLGRRKSYNYGRSVRCGGRPWGDLMIFPGPGRLSGLPRAVARCAPLRCALDLAFAPPALAEHVHPTPWKIARWLRDGVAVAGRPDWVFLKLHAHGARPRETELLLGGMLRQLHVDLRQVCARSGWQLHYVTAREAYNMVKAAEAGKSGDPGRYRDFVLGPYQNTR